MAVTLLVGAATFLLGFNDGSYKLTDRSAIAIAAWWALAVGVALKLWPGARLPRAAIVATGCDGRACAAHAALDRVGGLRREGLPRVHARAHVRRRAGARRLRRARASRGRGERRARAGDRGRRAGRAREPVLVGRRRARRAALLLPGPARACTIRSTTGTASRSSPGSRCRCCCAPRSRSGRRSCARSRSPRCPRSRPRSI